MVVPPLRRFEAQKRKKWVFLSVWPIKLVSWSQENGNALRTPLKSTKKNLQPGSLVVPKGLEGVKKKKNGRSLSFVKVPGKKNGSQSLYFLVNFSPRKLSWSRGVMRKGFFFLEHPFFAFTRNQIEATFQHPQVGIPRGCGGGARGEQSG